MIKTQQDFSGGMNLLVNDTQIPEDQYRVLINARQRLGRIEPNAVNTLIETAPAGLKQGLIAVGNVLVLFVAGKAYFNVEGTTVWIKIPAFDMDATAVQYWTQEVPASTFNYTRKLNTSRNVSDAIVNALDFTINGTQAGIIVQDNINQPWIIFYDSTAQAFTSRVTQNYSSWTPENPEYVPIGKQMFTLNQKLFVVGRDGTYVMHSVSGRPVDFMVNVDIDGNKLPSETKGGAKTLAFSFDSDVITCIKSINIPDSFVYATKHITRVLTLDYQNTIFGEPRVRESAPIRAGVVNNESFCELLGDYAFIDAENVKSFNAVQQLKFSGRNSIFSLMLASLLHDIKQTEPACTVFNDYGLFYIKTSWGNAVAVYDTLRERWVSLDITEVDRVKQFAQTTTDTSTKLYCITRDNKLYSMYGGSDIELAQLYTRAFQCDDPRNEHKTNILNLTLQSGTSDGEATVLELVDDMAGQRLTQTLDESRAGITFPIQFPILFADKNLTDGITYTLKDGAVGKKLAYIIMWNTDAKLQGYKLTTTEKSTDVSLKQSAKAYVNG